MLSCLLTYRAMPLKSLLVSVCLLGCAPRVHATGYVSTKWYTNADCSGEAGYTTATSVEAKLAEYSHGQCIKIPKKGARKDGKANAQSILLRYVEDGETCSGKMDAYLSDDCSGEAHTMQMWDGTCKSLKGGSMTDLCSTKMPETKLDWNSTCLTEAAMAKIQEELAKLKTNPEGVCFAPCLKVADQSWRKSKEKFDEAFSEGGCAEKCGEGMKEAALNGAVAQGIFDCSFKVTV
mmetsp:Transcript_45244/g.104940  ORF Transcript_45244/g.104940 Transcript_45244/m.104940 type:complete len:235 (-) Transcript_45244:138-842(-)